MTKLYATQTVDLSDEEITKVAGGYMDLFSVRSEDIFTLYVSYSAVEILT